MVSSIDGTDTAFCQPRRRLPRIRRFLGLQAKYTAEMAQPLGPNNTFLYPQSLWEVMESAKSCELPVEKIIGMHMSPTDWLLLVKTVDQAIAGQPAPTLHD